MDTRKYHKGQIVEADAHLNQQLGPDGTIEVAHDNVVYDYEIDGIISGLVASQAATPDMTVDISTGVAYDGDGKRCRVSSGQNVDLSGVSLPASGNEKYVSIYISNAKVTSEDWIDDDGTTGYWKHEDSFSITYAEGAEAGAGTATPPSLHATNRLIVDVLLYYGMTVITNSDLKFTRKEVSVWPAERLTIDASGWTELSTDNTTVQETLTEIDGKLISRDGTGDIDQDLIPDGSVDLGSASDQWLEAHIGTLTAYTKIAVKKINIDTTTGTQAIDFDTGQTGDKVQKIGRATVMDSDNWNYTNASGYQVWQSAAHANRQYLAVSMDVHHGVLVTSIDVVWEQASSTTNNMQVTLYRVSRSTGARSSLGSVTIGTFGSQQDDNWDISDFTVDNGLFEYIFEVASSDASAAICQIYSIRVNYTITDIMKTVLG